MEVDAGAIREKMRGLPVAGFFTGSEIAPIGKIDHLHQYSGVLVLLGEDTA
jgi:small ligand-binding sensory domain FIST